MAVDPAVLRQIREWTGSTPDEVVIEDALDANDGAPLRAALSILLVRRSDLIAAPGKKSVDSDYSREITKTQLDALDGLIDQLRATIAADEGGEDVALSGAHVVSTAAIEREEDAPADRRWWV